MSKIIIKSLSRDEFIQLKIAEWPVWEKEVSRFSAEYDEEEHCYFLHGKVIIETENGEFVIAKNDFVIFPKGLKCIWDIKEAVKKHYNFIES